MLWDTLVSRLTKPIAGLYGPQVSEHPPYILVVEDEAVIRSQIAVILEEEGFLVQQAGDAAEAYALLMDQPTRDSPMESSCAMFSFRSISSGCADTPRRYRATAAGQGFACAGRCGAGMPLSDAATELRGAVRAPIPLGPWRTRGSRAVR